MTAIVRFEVGRDVAAILAAVLAGTGMFALTFVPTKQLRAKRRTFIDWMRQAGVENVSAIEFVAVELAVLVVVTTLMWAMFGAVLPAILTGIGALSAPLAVYRNRRAALTEAARDAWPAMLEELRLQVGALGRSVPAALLDVGLRAPTEPTRQAFAAAHREWLLSTDFSRVVRMLQERLADATADTVLETLLVANEIGGTDIDRRLARLSLDRQVDLRHRHEALSRQSGVRFARWFVLIVPFAMALIGLGIGDGRGAYSSLGGQITGGLAVALVAACWWWSGTILRLPPDRRIARVSQRETP